MQRTPYTVLLMMRAQVSFHKLVGSSYGRGGCPDLHFNRACGPTEAVWPYYLGILRNNWFSFSPSVSDIASESLQLRCTFEELFASFRCRWPPLPNVIPTQTFDGYCFPNDFALLRGGPNLLLPGEEEFLIRAISVRVLAFNNPLDRGSGGRC